MSSFFNEYGYCRDREPRLREVSTGLPGSLANEAANQIKHLKAALRELVSIVEIHSSATGNDFDTVGGYHLNAYNHAGRLDGKVIGKSGNAVLLELPLEGVAVVSMPRSEGYISDLYPECALAYYVDLSWAF